VDTQSLIFLGTQGSGKGTQLGLLKDFIAEKDPGRAIVQVGMGKLMRELENEPTYAGRRAKEILAGGNLIPYAVSTARLTNYLISNLVIGDEHLLIDGYPRTPEQVPALDSAMEYFGRNPVTVVVLEISEEEAVKRLKPRGRADDTEEGIRRRLKWSREQTMPNIKWFKEHGGRYKVVEVFGERPIEEVQAEIRQKLGLA
jgi:adenylate kinase